MEFIGDSTFISDILKAALKIESNKKTQCIYIYIYWLKYIVYTIYVLKKSIILFKNLSHFLSTLDIYAYVTQNRYPFMATFD